MTDQVTTPAVDPANPNPAPTPQPAPVTVPDPAPKTDPPATVEPSKGITPTGDASIDVALGYFSKLGLSEDSPEMQEAANGNFQYLKAKLGTMGAKAEGWEGYLKLAEDGYARHTKSLEEADTARTKAVYDAVGGEENWNAIAKWTGENAEADEKEAFKEMLGKGGMFATVAATFLASKYAAASGTTLEGASAVGDAANVSEAPKPLTRATYREELNGLIAKFGANGLEGRPEYQELRRRGANIQD